MNAKFLRLLLIAVLALCMGAVAACGDDDDDSTSGGSHTEEAASTPEAEKIKVGMVTDIGGLNDRSFNEAAYKGLQKAESELGVEIRALTSKAPTDYVPNLTTLARQQYDLIIAVGFLMAEDTEKIANQFPDTNFAIIDSSQQAMKTQAQEPRGPPVQGERGGLPRRLHGRPVHEGQGRRPGRLHGRRPQDPAGGRLHRRVPEGRARREPEDRHAERRTRRTSSTRRSARRSRSTRSRRARRSSSRSPAAAASARSTRPRRRACRASASTPTRATWATRS